MIDLVIVSGGQTGADQAAWRAARTAGIATAGFMPLGYLTEDGPRPDSPSPRPGPDPPGRFLISLEMVMNIFERARAIQAEAEQVARRLEGLVPDDEAPTSPGDDLVIDVSRLADIVHHLARSHRELTVLVAKLAENQAYPEADPGDARPPCPFAPPRLCWGGSISEGRDLVDVRDERRTMVGPTSFTR